MTSIYIISGAAVALFIGFLTFSYYRTKNEKPPKKSPKIIEVTNKNFKGITRSGISVMNFWATWSVHSKMLIPALNDIAENEKLKVNVGMVNVNQQKVLTKKLKIHYAPTLIIFKDGEEITRFTSIKSKKVIMKEIEKLL